MYIFKIIKNTFYKKLFTKIYLQKVIFWNIGYWKNMYTYFVHFFKKSVCKCIISKSLLPHVLLCFSIVRWNIVSGYSFFLWNINGADCLLSDFQLHDGGTPRGLQMWCEVYASISHFLSQLSWKKWRVSLGKKKWRFSLGRLKSYNEYIHTYIHT